MEQGRLEGPAVFVSVLCLHSYGREDEELERSWLCCRVSKGLLCSHMAFYHCCHIETLLSFCLILLYFSRVFFPLFLQ